MRRSLWALSLWLVVTLFQSTSFAVSVDESAVDLMDFEGVEAADIDAQATWGLSDNVPSQSSPLSALSASAGLGALSMAPQAESAGNEQGVEVADINLPVQPSHKHHRPRHHRGTGMQQAVAGSVGSNAAAADTKAQAKDVKAPPPKTPPPKKPKPPVASTTKQSAPKKPTASKSSGPSKGNLLKLLHDAQRSFEAAKSKLDQHKAAFSTSQADLSSATKAAEEAQVEMMHLQKLSEYVTNFFAKAKTKLSAEKARIDKITKQRQSFQMTLDTYTTKLKTAHAALIAEMKRTACLHDIDKTCPNPKHVCVPDGKAEHTHYRKCLDACVATPNACPPTKLEGYRHAVSKDRHCVCEAICPPAFCSSNATTLETNLKKGLTRCSADVATSGPSKGERVPTCVNPCKIAEFAKDCKDQGDLKCVPTFKNPLGYECVDLCKKSTFKCPNSADPAKKNDILCKMQGGAAVCLDPCKLMKTPCGDGLICERDFKNATASCEEICPKARNPCAHLHSKATGWRSQCANVKNTRHCGHICHTNPATGVYPCKGNERCKPVKFARDPKGFICEPACPLKAGDRNPCPRPEKVADSVCLATGKEGKYTCHHPCSKEVNKGVDPCGPKAACTAVDAEFGKKPYKCVDLCLPNSCPTLPLTECTLASGANKDGFVSKNVQCRNPCDDPARKAECAKSKSQCQPSVVTDPKQKPYICSNKCSTADSQHCLQKKVAILCRINANSLGQCYNPCHFTDPVTNLHGAKECAKHNQACVPDKYQRTTTNSTVAGQLFKCVTGCEAFKDTCEHGTRCVNTIEGPTYHKCEPVPAAHAASKKSVTPTTKSK